MALLLQMLKKESLVTMLDLQAGDVIIEFNGKEIKFGSDLPHVVGRIQPNTKANAKIIRDGKDITLKVHVLGELPADERTFIPAKTEVSS